MIANSLDVDDDDNDGVILTTTTSKLYSTNHISFKR
jgi:hypothetical protein